MEPIMDKYNIFEDEDDFFMGSPKSKFIDIIYNANRNLAEAELVRIMRRLAATELLLGEFIDEDEIDRKVEQFLLSEEGKVDEYVKNIYIEHVGNVLSANE
jgi:hypothetical protein